MELALSNPVVSPFQNNKYQGKIKVEVTQDPKSSACLIEVKGARITLRTFQGPYLEKLQDAFGSLVQVHSNEFIDMKGIFGSSIARIKYANGELQSDEQIERRIEFNARRALEGNPFTGFAAVENTTNKIIGFVSLGRGFQSGESQSSLILNPDYREKHYGKEIALLAACLAQVYFLNQFEVGSKTSLKAVESFTVTARDSNEVSVDFIQKMGLSKIRPLTSKEAYTDEPATLYGIEGANVEKALEKYIDLHQFSWDLVTF